MGWQHSFGWPERLLLARALTGVSPIGCSDAEAISTSDCQSMMSLRKGWMDGRIGCKVLYISALECSEFFRKKLKNATWDGIGLLKKKVLKTKYFLVLVSMAKVPRQFLTSFLKFV